MEVVIKAFIWLIEAYVGKIAWPLHRILSNSYQCECSSYFNAQRNWEWLIYLAQLICSLNWNGGWLVCKQIFLIHIGIKIENPLMQPTLQIGACTMPFQQATLCKMKILSYWFDLIADVRKLTLPTFPKNKVFHHGEKPNKPNICVA